MVAQPQFLKPFIVYHKVQSVVNCILLRASEDYILKGRLNSDSLLKETYIRFNNLGDHSTKTQLNSTYFIIPYSKRITYA